MSGLYAAIDIGTNSTLLLVGQAKEAGRVDVVADQCLIAGLGRGARPDGSLSDESMDRTVGLVSRLVDSAGELGVPAGQLIITGTAALRRAPNDEAFQERLAARCGHRVTIIDGDTEARWSMRAVAGTLPIEGSIRILDIGGGSTEVVDWVDGRIAFATSLPIGSVRLTEETLQGDPPTPESCSDARDRLATLLAPLPELPTGATVVGVGGTVTTLLATQAGIDPYDASRVHGARLPLADLSELASRLCSLNVTQRTELPALSETGRAAVICGGALVLLACMQGFTSGSVVACDAGLRHGALLEHFGLSGFGRLFP